MGGLGMNIEEQIANQVRQLPDKQLAEMALQAGFTVNLVRAKPIPRSVVVPQLRSKKAATTIEEALAHPKHNVLAALQNAGKDGRGFGTADLVTATGLTQAAVLKGIKAGIEDGSIFKGGDKRFTRYGDTQKIADDASVSARGG